MPEPIDTCAHENQVGHRYCNQCGARLTNAATKRESFREHLDKKLAEGDVK